MYINVYQIALDTESIWTRLGPEFVPDCGKNIIVLKTLYGLKAWEYFVTTLLLVSQHLFITLVWLTRKYGTNQKLGRLIGKYYSYISLYVYDVLCIHPDGIGVLILIDNFAKTKEDSTCDPNMYLAANLCKICLPNVIESWATYHSKYIQEAVKNTEYHLAKEQSSVKLVKRVSTPVMRDCKPELDVRPKLRSTEALYYQSQIGFLQWMTNIGYIDMIIDVSKVANQLAIPR